MSAAQVALSLAAVGWHVFPCSPEGKPLVSWGEEATTDPTTIRRWFRQGERIGIHCGRSGLLVVDRDRKDGRDGFASLKQAGITPPRTFHYKSRSGRGRHDVYEAPAGITCTIAADVHGMTGVDVRAGVGMVIYNGPALTEAPALAPAPAWAVVHRKETAYSSTVSLEEWLAEERSAYPSTKALSLAKAVPLDGVTNAELLRLITPLVDDLAWGNGRREAYDIARERYTRNYPDAGEAFDRAWVKAIARVEGDWRAMMQAVPTECERPRPRAPLNSGEPTPRARRVADLLRRDFPTLDWIVPDVIPDGCHLLVAAPKIGKSLLTLMLAIACANGTRAFDAIKVRVRPVLLLDLESGDRRLSGRLHAFEVTTVPESFEFHTDPETALTVMSEFMKRHKGRSPLVILDTLSEVMGPKPRDLAPMLHEKRTLQPIQRLCAEDPGASVLIVHHTRKDKSGDSVDSSSGTHGLTGAVDGVFVLDRPDRQKPEATLIRNSRDIEDALFGMTLNGVMWTFDGHSAGKARQAAQERIIHERIEKQGRVGHKLLDLLKEHGPLTPAEAFELYDGDAKIQTVRNALSRLVFRELASKDDTGRYRAIYTPELGEFSELASNSGNSPNSGGYIRGRSARADS